MQELRVFPQWRTEHEFNKYPFADNSTLANADNDFFAEGIFLDAAFYPVDGQERMYISKVVVTHQSCTIVIGDAAVEERASGTFALIPEGVDPGDDTTDRIVRFFDSVGRPAGVIVSTTLRLSIFQAWKVGTHLFQPSETELAATVCIPMPGIGVRGFLLDDGSVMTGDVWIVGDDGVVLSFENEFSPDECGEIQTCKAIRVDVVGDPLFRRRLCEEPTFFQTPRFIQTITAKVGCDRKTLTPDETGEFHMVAGSNLAPDAILRFRPVPGGLVIEAVGERVEGPSGPR